MLASFRVLIVDADADHCAELHRLFDATGAAYQSIEMLASAEDALAWCRAPVEGAQRLVLLDIRQAGPQGIEWLRRLRGQALHPPLPVVMIGDDEQDSRADAAMASGAQDYLIRRYLTPKGLLRRLANALARHRLIQDLAASEQRFRLLADTLPEIIWVSDQQGRVEFVNQRWTEYTGQTPADALGQGTWASIHPEDLPRVLASWEQAATTGRAYEGEMRLRQAGGKYRWFLVRSLPLRGPDGKIEKWFGASTNIDARKRTALAERAINRLLSEARQVGGPDPLAAALVTRLAQELGVELCLYAEMDRSGEQCMVYARWHNGVLTGCSQLPLDQILWPGAMPRVAAGQPLAIDDLTADARTAALAAEGKLNLPGRGLLLASSPIDPARVALLLVATAEPHSWTQDEIALLEGAAGPIWLVMERARTEQSLLESEARFRLTLQGSPIMVAELDAGLRYVWVHNPLPGVASDQIIGRRDDEIMPAEAARPLLELKQEVLATGATLRRELPLGAGSTYARVDVTAEPLRDSSGRITGMTLVAMDITERTRAEERLAFLAEASKLLSSSLDYAETLRRVAHAMVPHFADWCAVDLLTPENSLELVAVAHVDPAKVEWGRALRRRYPVNMQDPAGLAHVIRTGQPEFYPDIDLEAIMAQVEDEETRRVLREVGYKSVIFAPLSARGQTLGAITLVWSDSDRRYNEADLGFAQELARRAAIAIDNARLYQEARRAEAELRGLNETLEQRVQERTEELLRSNQELDQFAYVASHDLKAPLRAIDHLANWLEEDAGHLLPVRSREHLDKMRSRIQRMEGLLDDLLAYSRAGRYVGEASTVDTHELVQGVVDTVTPPEQFTVTVDAAMPRLVTQHIPLEMVLRNLVANAVKHHDKRRGHIHISARENGEWVEFSVSDDGPGIDPAYHERVFQMFQTLRPRDHLEGSGIGLAVVKKIVEGAGGRVWVESAPGTGSTGSTFRFTWPKHA